ncbi:MAG: acetyl-CoA C-acyltransferase, partial [Salinisphaera sp.]|nr:acetyl-CoA C-acyltransferase [Salinisphaera sp.]
MREAVIVSTARTGLGKSYRGSFNNTMPGALGAHAIKHAVQRAGVDAAEGEDVVFGCALQQGAQDSNIARQSALLAGLPVSVPGMTIDRRCSSGLMAIATAAKQVILDGQDIAIGGGVESISMVQTKAMNVVRDENLRALHPHAYLPMIDTAEVVGKRYNVSRASQDEYALQSQQRTAAGQQAGRFDDEIVPLPSVMKVQDRET